MKQNMVWYYGGLILVAAIWGTNFAVSRLGMDSFDPVLFSFIRFGGAVPLFFVLLKIKEGSVGVPVKTALQIAGLGLMGITCLELLVMYSIRYTTLANASLLNVAPWPIFAALFAPMFTKERLTSRIIQGGSIALVGVALVILGGGEGFDISGSSLAGMLMALSASVIGALYNLVSVSLMNRYSALRVTTWTLGFGALFMLPLTWGTWSKVEWTGLGGDIWVAIFYNIVLSTVLAFVMWNACMYKVGATRANFFRYVVPAAAVVAGFIMFDEGIRFWQLIGAAFMAAGLVWIQREKTES